MECCVCHIEINEGRLTGLGDNINNGHLFKTIKQTYVRRRHAFFFKRTSIKITTQGRFFRSNIKVHGTAAVVWSEEKNATYLIIIPLSKALHQFQLFEHPKTE